MLFALALTAVGTVLGIVTGAIQGFFGGKTDLAFQRFIEVWGSMPELYLLIIFSAILAPSLGLLLVLLSLFGWMGLSDYVRAEFLRNRQMDYVRAARAMGLSSAQIIWRHVLPNSLTPVVTFLPFRMSAAILALTSLDFLGLGVPPGTPSLGRTAEPGQEQHRRMVDFTVHLCCAGGHAVAADIQGRCLARCPGPEKAGPMTSLLDVRKLAVTFNGLNVVHEIDFSIALGEKLALVGESGSGKTVSALSLLRLVHGAEVSGSAQLGGRDLLRMSEHQLRGVRGDEVAVIFQEPMTALNPLYTVGAQIAEVLQLKKGFSAAQAQAATVELLASTGIPEPARRAGAYPPPAQRWPAPARNDRHGPGQRTETADCRRTHHGGWM